MAYRTVLAAVAVSAIAGAAQAATTLIDFTDRSQWTGGGNQITDPAPTTVQNYGGLTVSLTSNPAGNISFKQDFDGPAGAADRFYCQAFGGPLACESDGLGVVSDEIDSIDPTQLPPLQSATVEFSKPVRILGVHFLDLFRTRDNEDVFEKGLFYIDGNPLSLFAFDANPGTVGNVQNGYKFGALNVKVLSTITFFPAPEPFNDGRGKPDVALAAIEVAPVPVPASVAMLLGALGGFGLLSRRRRAAA